MSTTTSTSADLTDEQLHALKEAAKPLWDALADLGLVAGWGGAEFERAFPAAIDTIHAESLAVFREAVSAAFEPFGAAVLSALEAQQIEDEARRLEPILHGLDVEAARLVLAALGDADADPDTTRQRLDRLSEAGEFAAQINQQADRSERRHAETDAEWKTADDEAEDEKG